MMEENAGEDVWKVCIDGFSLAVVAQFAAAVTGINISRRNWYK